MLALSLVYAFSPLGIPTVDETKGIPLIDDNAEYSMIIPIDFSFKELAIMPTFAWWLNLISLGLQ